MKKKDQAPETENRIKRTPRRLSLARETIQRLHEPLLERVMGGVIGHTFTGYDNGADQSWCG
jgi:hypothetical protein